MDVALFKAPCPPFAYIPVYLSTYSLLAQGTEEEVSSDFLPIELLLVCLVAIGTEGSSPFSMRVVVQDIIVWQSSRDDTTSHGVKQLHVARFMEK